MCPIISTHHSMLFINENVNENDRYNSDISIVVSNITFEILKDSPGLVADVANGTADRAVLETAVIKVIDKHKYRCGLSRDDLINKIFDYMFGYGALQTYIDDEDISDIDGTKYDEFVIKRNGVREVIPVSFGNEEIFDTYCKLIAIRNGGILNENDSHCRVTDEKRRLRINVSIRPRNISGPSISIRKHRVDSYSMFDLVELGMMSKEIAEFFYKISKTDATILFCGKGAAGKTTLMRAFVNILPPMERVLIAESDAEIYPDKPYCIEQRIKKQYEGGRSISLGDLVKDGLTMSLDTYCIGEIVGEEAWEYIKAAFTGHRCLATTHSESAEDALARLISLCRGVNSQEDRTTKAIMAKSIDLIVFLNDFRIQDIVEVCSYDSENDRYDFNRLFRFEPEYKTDFSVTNGSFTRCGEPAGKLAYKLERGA